MLSIGECMIEIAPAGNGLHRVGYAGDTFNTAWYARRLMPGDWTVGYCTRVGTDSASAGMTAFMRDAGIDVSTISRDEARTVGLYLIELKDGERSFSYWRGQSAAKGLADDPARLEKIFAKQSIIHFSGITLAILSTKAQTALCDALATARKGGATIAFDTNLRPKLWESREAMRAGIQLGAASADIVLPSFDEEQWLWDDAGAQDTIARYHDLGATVVAVKNGGDPVTVWSEAGGEHTVPVAKPERVVDTTAAGDSFAAAFLAAHSSGASAGDAASAASRIAAKVIGGRGALVDIDTALDATGARQ
jgi:2-dehydro-3-deoxygluconokinase